MFEFDSFFLGVVCFGIIIFFLSVASNKISEIKKFIIISVCTLIIFLLIIIYLAYYYGWESTIFDINAAVKTEFTDNITDTIDIDSQISTDVIVGSRIKFGEYNWKVIDIKNNKILIISEDVIKIRMCYDKEGKEAKWETSSIRQWLNIDFYDTFKEQDKERITLTTNINEKNKWYMLNDKLNNIEHNNTQDKIFLLSLSEIIKYFGDSGQLNELPENSSGINDQFNKDRIAYYNEKPVSWWLRTPVYDSDYPAVATVNDHGEIYGVHITHILVGRGTDIGIRPAIWIILN